MVKSSGLEVATQGERRSLALVGKSRRIGRDGSGASIGRPPWALIPSVHAFRCSASDPASATEHANHVVEIALAHTIPSKVEAAYRRRQLLEKRRVLMADWAAFLTRSQIEPATRHARFECRSPEGRRRLSSNPESTTSVGCDMRDRVD